MRYPIKISPFWRPLFTVFGFSAKSSYLELEGGTLTISFGTALERISLENIAGVTPRSWPFYYGLGAKLGPRGSVAYVGSMDGVVEIELASPQPLNVWGPFRRKEARSVIVSLEDPEAFMEAVRAGKARGMS